MITTQTPEEIHEQIAIWSKYHQPATLAEDAFNRDAIGSFVARVYGGQFTVEILNEAVRVLRPQLHWLGEAPAPAKRKHDVWNALATLGILKCPQPSWSEQEEAEKKRTSVWDDARNNIAVIRDRNALKRELLDAKYLQVYYPNGRVDFSSSQRESEKALSSVRNKIEAWNRKHPEHAIEV